MHQSVQAIITDNGVPSWNKLRLVILFALRYQKTQTSNIASLINLMLANGVSREDARVGLFLLPLLQRSLNYMPARLCVPEYCWYRSTSR